jgi:hypothetical protein
MEMFSFGLPGNDSAHHLPTRGQGGQGVSNNDNIKSKLVIKSYSILS